MSDSFGSKLKEGAKAAGRQGLVAGQKGVEAGQKFLKILMELLRKLFGKFSNLGIGSGGPGQQQGVDPKEAQEAYLKEYDKCLGKHDEKIKEFQEKGDNASAYLMARQKEALTSLRDTMTKGEYPNTPEGSQKLMEDAQADLIPRLAALNESPLGKLAQSDYASQMDGPEATQRLRALHEANKELAAQVLNEDELKILNKLNTASMAEFQEKVNGPPLSPQERENLDLGHSKDYDPQDPQRNNENTRDNDYESEEPGMRR